MIDNPDADRTHTRRAVLAAGAAGAGVAAVAACSTAEPSSSPPSSQPTSSQVAAGGSSAAASTAPGGALTTVAAVPVGGSVAVEHDGSPALVAQPTAGTVVAFSAVCPHQGCTVAPGPTTLDCPCHNSTFDTATGNRLTGPARTGLTPIAVSVVDGSVVAS